MPPPPPLPLLLLLALASAAAAAAAGEGPRVLMVQAHPDDETECAASLFAAARNLNGTVDIAVVTDGQGGYNCSTGAEWIYGLKLTDPAVGRRHLPAIRQREMLESAEALGVRDVHFLGQPDVKYSLNASLPLAEWWDVPAVAARLDYILRAGAYDLVLVFLPDPATHGEHKAASILALEAVARVPAGSRPLVAATASPGVRWPGALPGYPVTAASSGPSAHRFNRSAAIPGSRINYHVIVDMALSRHRSQGCLMAELSGPRQEIEEFYFFDANGEARRTEFDSLIASVVSAPYAQYPGCGL